MEGVNMVKPSHCPNPPTCPSSTDATSATKNKKNKRKKKKKNKKIEIEVVPTWKNYYTSSKRLFLALMIGMLSLIGGFNNFNSIHNDNNKSTYQEDQRLAINTTSLFLPPTLQQLSSISTIDDKMSTSVELSSSVPISSSSSSSLQSLPTVCKPFFMTENRKIKRIFVYHMRKAGGTTILHYFRKVAKVYNLEFMKQEGGFAEDPSIRRNDTFYITFMRDPIERTISHYKYDFRWSCKDLVYNKSYIPTIENSKSIQTFLMNDTHRKLGQSCKRRNYVWTCSANCYTRWLALPYGKCDRQPLIKNNNNSDSFSTKISTIAYEKMKQYDLIIDSNRLFRDKKYGHGIERFFQVRGLQGSHQDAWCSNEAKKANKRNPLVLDDQTVQYIRDRNVFDYQLYNEFILPCRNVTIQFPTLPFPMYTHHFLKTNLSSSS